MTDKANWRGDKFGAMTLQEINEFLAEPWISRTACLKPDGSPFVFASWYHWDGVAFWLVARARSAWAHYLVNDPRVTVLVDEPTPPIRKVTCEGTAVCVEAAVGPYLENGEMSIWNKIGKNETHPRYTGDKTEYADEVNIEPCWTFKIVPRKLTTWQGFGWAKKYKHDEFTGPDGTVVTPKYYG